MGDKRFYIEGDRVNDYKSGLIVVTRANFGPLSIQQICDTLNAAHARGEFDPPKAEPQPELFLRADGSQVENERVKDEGLYRWAGGDTHNNETNPIKCTAARNLRDVAADTSHMGTGRRIAALINELFDRRATKWEPQEERKGERRSEIRRMRDLYRVQRRYWAAENNSGDGLRTGLVRRVTTGTRADRKGGAV